MPPSNDYPPLPPTADRVDLVDAGADRTGERPITDVLSRVAADDTRVIFPSGRYRLETLVLDSYDGLQLVAPDGATLVPATTGKSVLSFRDCANVHVRGFTVDSRAKDTSFSLGIHGVGGDSTVAKYALRGRQDSDSPTHGLLIKCEGGDTSITAQDVYFGDGAENDGIGVFIFPNGSYTDPSRDGGTVTLRDVHVEGWHHEGVYGSPHRGPLNVIGGLYKNNAIEQVRVGGGNADDHAHLKGVTIVVDDPPSYIGDGTFGPKQRNYRGIWCEEGDGVTIEDCRVHIGQIDQPQARSSGGIVVKGEFGRATIQNSRVRIDMSDTPAIRCQQPVTYDPDTQVSLDHAPPSHAVSIHDVEITGTATGSAGIVAARRPVHVKHCYLRGTGGHRVGIESRDAVVFVSETIVETTGSPFVPSPGFDFGNVGIELRGGNDIRSLDDGNDDPSCP